MCINKEVPKQRLKKTFSFNEAVSLHSAFEKQGGKIDVASSSIGMDHQRLPAI